MMMQFAMITMHVRMTLAILSPDVSTVECLAMITMIVLQTLVILKQVAIMKM
jgi:hypothetical protein